MEIFNQKKLKIFFASLISVAFCFFAFKNTDLSKISRLILDAELFYVIATFLTVLIAQVLRSIRWGIMLQPIQSLSQKILFPISSIGFMLIMLLPARLGELARPYLLSKNSKIKLSTSLSTIVLERILDIIFILILMGVIISYINVPNWIVKGAVIIMVAMISIIAVLILGKLERVNNYLCQITGKILPKRFAGFIEGKMKQFYEGMAVLRKGHHILGIIFLTASIWGVFILSNLLLLKAFHIQLGTFAALTVLTFTALGISVPAGPGFIGNFHFFCILGLSIFGIGKDLALSYALVNHALIMMTFSLLGIVSINLPGINLGFNFLKS